MTTNSPLRSPPPNATVTAPPRDSSRRRASIARAAPTRPAYEAPGNDNDIAGRASYAVLAMRLALGVMFLQHVMGIVFGYVPPDVSQLFGLPAGISAYALAWDALIGLALVYGLWPRLAAIAGAATLSVAMIAHDASVRSPFGWQFPLLWIAALLAFVLAGDGAFDFISRRGVSAKDRFSTLFR